MGPFLASAVSGQLVLPLLPVLPPFWWSLVLLPLLALLWCGLRWKWLLWLMPAVLTFSLSVVVAERQLTAEVPARLEQQMLRVQGQIVGLPESGVHGGWRVRLRPETAHIEGWSPQGVWLLNLRDAAMPLPGAVCSVSVRLKKPHGNANPGGFDYEAWLLSEGVTATGSAAQAECRPGGWSVDRLRLDMRHYFQQRFPGQQDMAGVVLALITGDRALVAPATWERYAATGVIHLMAISGMHITLLAVVAAWLALRMLRWVPGLGLLMPLHKPALLTGLGVALAYGLVAGFSVPTQRTLVMLAVVGVAYWWQRRLPVLQVVGIAMLVVLLWWPLSVHAAGFWLSFGAVALLTLIGQTRRHEPVWLQGVKLQLALSVALLPATVWFFERASWVSPFANLLAVPVVTFLVVPLGMVGMGVWLLSPTLAEGIWWLAIQIMTVLDALLAQFQSWPEASIDWSLPGRAGFIWALLAAMCLFQPFHPRLRVLAPLFLLPVFLVHQVPFPGSLRVSVLDVGQGLSVLLETGQYRLLYDTGPAFGEQDAGRRVILPFLRQSGVHQLDRLIVSHDDLDHTGGAASVLTSMPVTDVLGAWPASLATIRGLPHHTCVAGQSWQSEGWLFTVLSPEKAHANGNADNHQSCVLRVSKGRAILLLPGDLEAPGEYDLLDAGVNVGATVLVLGHHGAREASTTEWLRRVKPEWAVASAGYLNRFGHPAVAVRQRLTQAGIPLLSTADQGAIVMDMRATGEVRWQAYRPHAGRYWW